MCVSALSEDACDQFYYKVNASQSCGSYIVHTSWGYGWDGWRANVFWSSNLLIYKCRFVMFGNFLLLWSKFWCCDCYKILHMPQQLRCHILNQCLTSPRCMIAYGITRPQWFSGSGHDLLWDWASGLPSNNHHYVLHGHAIWVSGCRVPLLDCQAASSPRDPASWLGSWWWLRTSSLVGVKPLSEPMLEYC